MRLETSEFLYRRDTFIAVAICIVSTLAVFATRGMYNNLTQHISLETAATMAVGSTLSCTTLLCGILLLIFKYRVLFPNYAGSFV